MSGVSRPRPISYGMKHLNIKIYGNVQGVFFRWEAAREANELSITGFAENAADGSVDIEAEGEEENLKAFLKWCEKGPPSASVEKTEFEFSGELKNFKDFQMK